MNETTEKEMIQFMKAHFMGSSFLFIYFIFFGLLAVTENYLFAIPMIIVFMGSMTCSIMKFYSSYKITKENGKRKISEDMDM